MKEILKFYERLDRKLFIDGTTRFADINTALHIERGQTIPKPTTVMLMTKLLELNKICKVLEIGTGSGYNCAFLAEFAGRVYTVERIPELAQKAKSRLKAIGYKNVQYKIGDGSEGWAHFAPYDRIVVTAAAKEEPLRLLEQLKPQGIIIAPSYTESGRQDLVVYYKYGDSIEKHRITGVKFVPMIGDEDNG